MLKFDQNLDFTKDKVHTAGDILAFNIDPSITNDVESYYHDNDNPEDW